MNNPGQSSPQGDASPPPARSRLRWRRRRVALLAGAAAVVLALTGTGALVFAGHHQKQASTPSRPAAAAPLPTSPPSASPSPRLHKPTASTAPRASRAPASTRPPTAPPAAAPRAVVLPAGAHAPLATSLPVSLTVPALGVQRAPMLSLGLNADNTIQTPPLTRVSLPGWYKFSPTPGSLGPAIVLGHIDSAAYGPGVFFRLGVLAPGNEVDVARADGLVAVFRVDRVAEYPKSSFPSQLVYGDTGYAALRLVTCGGRFDTRTRNYLDNIVAYASLVAVHAAGSQ